MGYVQNVSVEHFEPETYDLYWRFVAERQRVYARRVNGASWPWTQDPILQAEFITNMYRELDPGTQYVMSAILDNDEDEKDVIFNIMMYRLMGSQESTHRHLGFVHVDEFSVETMLLRLSELPDEHRIFGDAYRVAGYHTEGGASKVENVAKMFQYFAGGMDETVRRVKAARRVREVFEVFMTMKGFGEFLAHQTTVDLLYPRGDEDPIVPFGQDEWAQAGPGARKGIWTLIKEGVQLSNLTQVMEYLRDHQQEEFEARDLQMPYLIDGEGEPVYLSLANIQSTLCEFYKYIRLWRGEKKVNVRKYDPQQATVITGPAVFLGEESLEQLLDITRCCTSPRPEIEPSEAPDASTLLSGEEPGEALEATEEKTNPQEEWGADIETRTETGSQTVTVEALPGVSISITINVFGTPRSAP